MEVRPIDSKSEWEEFLNTHAQSFYPLFQSWNWGEVQIQLGTELLRFGLFNEGKLLGIFQVTVIKARRGPYLHVRHGPVLFEFTSDYFDKILNFLKSLASAKKVSFIRFSPLIPKDSNSETIFAKLPFISSPIHNMDAEICWVLDLNKSEEELLSEMRKSHRYLIRKAPSMNIKIERTQKMSDIASFIELYKSLSKRKQFVPHRGVTEEFEIFAKDNQAELFLAYYEGKIISGAIILYVGNMGIYHHGASLDEYRNIPASYLIQWEAIQEAKRRGLKLYNFWGVAPTESKKHPWFGLSLFKMGFGGYKQEFLHAHDYIVSPLYAKTYAIELFYKKIKGY